MELPVKGRTIPAELWLPTGPGPFPGVAIGREATGLNSFVRDVAGRLADSGYAVVVPDYFHGEGPPDPEDHDDTDTIVGYIAALDSHLKG